MKTKSYKITFADDSVRYIRAENEDRAYWKAVGIAEQENCDIDCIEVFQNIPKARRKVRVG